MPPELPQPPRSDPLPPAPPAPARPRVWTVFLAYSVAVAALLVIGTVVIGAVVLFRALRGGTVSMERLQEMTAQVLALPSTLALSALVSASTLGGIALCAAAASPERARSRLRYGASSLPWYGIALGTLGFLALSQSGDSIISLLGLEGKGALAQMGERIAAARGWTLAALVVTLGLGAGVAEELFFRGYMQSRLRQRWGPFAAVLVTSVAFGLVHFDPIQSTFAFCAGLFLGWLAELSRSIRPGMVAHAVNNGVWVLGAAVWPGRLCRCAHRSLLPGLLVLCAGCVLLLLWSARGRRGT